VAKYFDMSGTPWSVPDIEEDYHSFKGIGLDPTGAYLLFTSESGFTIGALHASTLSVHRVLARQKTNSQHDYQDHAAPNTAHFYNGKFMGAFDYTVSPAYGCIFYVEHEQWRWL